MSEELEVELRHQREVLSLAMRASAMGAWSRDLATNAVWWSPELEDIVVSGRSRSESTTVELTTNGRRNLSISLGRVMARRISAVATTACWI